MSKYDKEREALGIKVSGASSDSANTKSKYARERASLSNPNFYTEDRMGDKKAAILEKSMHTEPVSKPPTYSGIDDVAVAKAEKFGTKPTSTSTASSPNYGLGNIDLHSRPKVKNPDGTISTVRSLGTNIDGQEVLIPTVRHGLDRVMSDDEAIDWYKKTGEYLGKFNTIDEANTYADKLHKDQEKYYSPPANYNKLTLQEQRLTPVGTNPFQTPAKLIPDIGTTKGAFNTIGKTFEALKSGAKPSREGMLNIIKQQKEMPKELALQRQQEFASSPAGAFGYGMSDRTLGTLNRAFMGDAWGNLVKTGEQAQPGYSTAGKVAGDIFMYSTVGKAVEGMGALQGIKNPFLRNLVGQQLADTAVQTPNVIMRGLDDKKSAGEIAKDVGIQQGQDLAGNLIMSGIEAGVKAIFKKIKAGKALAQADVDTVQKATKQMGGDPTASVDDQLKKLDDYFQQKRTDPLGGKLPKAEPKPLGGELPKADAPQGRVYGDTPKGDIPVGQKERGISHNVRTDTAMPDDMRTSFDERPLGYDPDTNPDTLKKAQTIFSQGEATATSEFYKGINEGIPEPEMVPLAKMLARQMSEAGNTEGGRQVLSDLAVKMTEAGQFSQAAKILREADPETFLMTMDKQIRKLNEQGLKQYGKKWANVDLLPDEITAIQGIQRGNQQAYEEVWEQIGKRIATDLPSTKMEKFDAWRRMAMLLNPKTHIRNVGGNVVMVGMRKSSDTLAAAFEKAFVPVGQRTKSFGWSLNKDIVSKVDDTWDIVKKDILGESRWEIDNLKSLGMEKKIFKNKALQGLNEFSLKTLNAEDNIFTQRAFKDALGQFMQANKLDVATDTAIAYAKRRALEATFKQANELASTLNRWKRIPVVGKFVEGAVPFTKTPANIVMRGIEYSPGGLIKALYDVKAGKTAATVIEDLSKGLVGSSITGLGFWLGSMGWAKVDRHRSQKAEALYSEMGDQTYAINTPLGSYTFDWAQPFAIPLAMGIAAQEAIRSRKDGSSLIMAIKDGIAAGGDTVFNMTMLRNIREIIGSYGSPTEKIMGIPVDYLEQAIFSVLGQTARTVDPVRRSTYDPDPTKQWGNTIKARIPGLSQSLEPSLGIWGQEQKQGNWVQQFINPGYFKERNNDPVTNEVARLYSGNKDNDMLPKVAPKSFSADKIEFRLTPKQLTEFQRRMGQDNHKEIGQLINSSEYRSMTDEQRIKEIKKIVNDNYEDIKKDIAKSK